MPERRTCRIGEQNAGSWHLLTVSSSRILYITPVINIQLRCAMKTDDKNLLFQQRKKKESLSYVLGIWLPWFQICKEKLVPVCKGWGQLFMWLIGHPHKYGNWGRSLYCHLLQSQCLLSNEEASRLGGDEPFSCPLMTFLHKLQGHRMFSILFPSNKRKINSPEESLIEKGRGLGRF